MNIFANGFPKTGNHALVKALELLGVPAEVNHRPFSQGLPKGTTHHVLIKRDPRDVVISMLRFNHQPVTVGTFLARFRKFQGASLVEEMAEYEPWLGGALTVLVRYEDLSASDREMRRIAAAIGIPYLEGSWEQLPGLTYTWNEVHSDYRAIWGPTLEGVWNSEGGADLLQRWGYGPEIGAGI